MTALISAELLKLRTTRAPWLTVAGALALAVAVPTLALLAIAQGADAELSSSTLVQALRSPVRLGAGAALLLGLLAAAGEYRHRTVLTTRLTEPRAARVIGAKLVAAAAAGLALGVLLEVLSGGVAIVALVANDLPVEPFAPEALRVLATVPLVLAAHAVVGVALGTLLRNIAVAVGAALLWSLVVEGLVPMVTRRPEVVHWLPGGAVNQIIGVEATPGAIGAGWAAALLGGYCVALVVASAAAESRRAV